MAYVPTDLRSRVSNATNFPSKSLDTPLFYLTIYLTSMV